MDTYRCSTCSATRTANVHPGRCRAATGRAGGPCGGEMVRPFALECTRCSSLVERHATPSDPSTVLVHAGCGGRLASR